MTFIDWNEMKLSLLLSVGFLTIGCATMIKSKTFATETKPEGFPEPTTTFLVEAKALINDGKPADAIAQLNDFQPDSKIDSLWKKYLLGVSYFANKDLEQGLEPLAKCYEKVKTDIEASSEDFRVAGLCLKKIGWFHRSKKDYTQAFAYHNFRYRYVLDHGSNAEIHDALISLDVDAYFLKDMHLSEKVLKESIHYGENIKDEKSRFMALGTTYNNLGGTLYGLNKFSESESAIKLALDFWEKYERIAGFHEFKVAWAYYGIGDVYEHWALYLKKNQENYLDKKNLALSAYQKALKLAKEREMPSSDQNYIKERIDSVKSL